MYASAQYINIISMISNNMKKKTNINFSDYRSSWKLTPVCDDWLVFFVPQFILQISITVFFQFFLYKDGLLSTSHTNFSTSSTIDITLWRKTQGWCTATLLLPVRARRLNHVRPIVISIIRGGTQIFPDWRFKNHKTYYKSYRPPSPSK